MHSEVEYNPSSWETVNCPFCNHSAFKVYERFGHKLQFTYNKCKSCSLIYTSPRPTYNQEFIDRAYATYYQFTEGLQLDNFTYVHTSSIPMFKSELDNLLNFDKEQSAVLDVGSGMGTFLYVAKNHYPICIGLDVSKKMGEFIEKNLGIKIFIEQFDQFQSPNKFSLIHMSHVIEHVPNPNEWIAKAKELLTKKGVLVINVPHKFSIGNKMQYWMYKLKLKKQYSSTWNHPNRTPDHLFEPTIKSMKYLFNKHEYTILDYFTYSRKDPASNKTFVSKFLNRTLKLGSNLSFIVTPK